MASDERVVLAEGGHAWTLHELREALSTQGLHVVTDADKRVLGAVDAWAKRLEPEDMLIQPKSVRRIYEAQLARREANRGK